MHKKNKTHKLLNFQIVKTSTEASHSFIDIMTALKTLLLLFSSGKPQIPLMKVIVTNL